MTEQVRVVVRLANRKREEISNKWHWNSNNVHYLQKTTWFIKMFSWLHNFRLLFLELLGILNFKSWCWIVCCNKDNPGLKCSGSKYFLSWKIGWAKCIEISWPLRPLYRSINCGNHYTGSSQNPTLLCRTSKAVAEILRTPKKSLRAWK